MSMDLPMSVQIFIFTLNTFGIFIGLAFVISLFIFWKEGKQSGFDEEKLFDLFLLSTLSAVVFSRLIYALQNHYNFVGTVSSVTRFWTPGFDYLGVLVGALPVIFLLTRKWKWSLFRILDIFSLSISMGLAIVFLVLSGYERNYDYLFVFSFYLILYAIMSVIRQKRAVSGMVFSLFLAVNSVFGYIFYKHSASLLFYVSLFTISMLNFIYRIKDNMAKIQKLPENLIKSLKKALEGKEKRLEKEQQELLEEDPYLQEGRASDNSEYIDEAILEDASKELYDIKTNSLNNMLSSVRKALAKMHIGTYGTCDVCGKAIEQKRLKAYPEATTCISCAARQSEK